MAVMQPDYYLSNAHKWLCTPPGSGFLYVKKELQHLIHPAVISGSYQDTFKAQFEWIGTRDYSPYLAVEAALDFRNYIGDVTYRNYTDTLCRDVANFLIKRWNTSSPIPLTMSASLINIGLPCNVRTPECYDWNLGTLSATLQQTYNIWASIYSIGTTRYIRISCQVYNEFLEYSRFADVFELLTKPIIPPPLTVNTIITRHGNNIY